MLSLVVVVDDANFFFVSRVIVAIFFSFSCFSFSISSADRNEKDLSEFVYSISIDFFIHLFVRWRSAKSEFNYFEAQTTAVGDEAIDENGEWETETETKKNCINENAIIILHLRDFRSTLRIIDFRCETKAKKRG